MIDVTIEFLCGQSLGVKLTTHNEVVLVPSNHHTARIKMLTENENYELDYKEIAIITRLIVEEFYCTCVGSTRYAYRRLRLGTHDKIHLNLQRSALRYEIRLFRRCLAVAGNDESFRPFRSVVQRAVLAALAVGSAGDHLELARVDLRVEKREVVRVLELIGSVIGMTTRLVHVVVITDTFDVHQSLPGAIFVVIRRRLRRLSVFVGSRIYHVHFYARFNRFPRRALRGTVGIIR